MLVWCYFNAVHTTMAASAQKRSAHSSAVQPLLDVGILKHILEYVGPGQWLFVGTVCSLWRDTSTLPHVNIWALKKFDDKYHAVPINCSPRCTLLCASVASPSRLRLAHQCGLDTESEAYQCTVGECAGFDTVHAALELGLTISSAVFEGAAASDSEEMLAWMYMLRPCTLSEDVSLAAAANGSIAALKWLRAVGAAFSATCCCQAAAHNHFSALQYLHAEGFPFCKNVCEAAARTGNLAMVAWAREQGAPFRAQGVFNVAAWYGNLQLAVWVRQQQPDLEMHSGFMSSAAQSGEVAMCQYLLDEHCPFDEHTAYAAVHYSQLSTLRFLREHGCPWQPLGIRRIAVHNCCLDVVQYLQQHGIDFTPAQLTKMLANAGAQNKLAAAQWLRQQGVDWTAELVGQTDVYGYTWRYWKGEVLAWARQEGCTSPVGCDFSDDDTCDDSETES
jgi:hypothetical protein